MTTLSDFDVWKRVELAISAEARRLCAVVCDGCQTCPASRDREWRREAIHSLRAKAAATEITLTPEGWFDEFWRAFPAGRKSGKADARNTFVRIIAGKSKGLTATPEELVLGAMRYAAAMGDNHKFVVMPARWLREGRWQDDDVGFAHLTVERQSAVDAAFDGLLAELRGDSLDG